MRFAESFAGRWLFVCSSISLVVITILGGWALIALAIGPSWSEICVAKGGEFVHEQVPFEHNETNWADNEKCVMPGDR